MIRVEESLTVYVDDGDLDDLAFEVGGFCVEDYGLGISKNLTRPVNGVTPGSFSLCLNETVITEAMIEFAFGTGDMTTAGTGTGFEGSGSGFLKGSKLARNECRFGDGLALIVEIVAIAANDNASGLLTRGKFESQLLELALGF